MMEEAKGWLEAKFSMVPKTSIGWFRAGVGFYNKQEFDLAVDCFTEAVKIDPKNYNAFQVMARALISLNRKTEAIEALKQSVKLENPSDWQLLVELTNGGKGDIEDSDDGVSDPPPPAT